VTLLLKYELTTAHVGKKTIAIMFLEKSISAEYVMGITCHSDYKSFQRYVKVTEERKRNDVEKLGVILNCKKWREALKD